MIVYVRCNSRTGYKHSKRCQISGVSQKEIFIGLLKNIDSLGNSRDCNLFITIGNMYKFKIKYVDLEMSLFIPHFVNNTS